MEAREDRRDRTYRRAVRRQRQQQLFGSTRSHAQVAWPLGRFAKRSWFTCNCRHRRHGNPKVGFGLCSGNSIREVVRDRSDARQACQRWCAEVRAGLDPSD